MRIDFKFLLQKNKVGPDGKPTGEVISDGLIPIGFLVLGHGRNNYVTVTTFQTDDNNLAVAIGRAHSPQDQQFLQGRFANGGTYSGFKTRVLEEVNNLPLDTGSTAYCATLLIAKIVEQAPGIKCRLETEQLNEALGNVEETVTKEDVPEVSKTEY